MGNFPTASGTGVMGLPRNCRGLFNWGRGAKNTADLDESFCDSDEYNEEFRRLRGDVMPSKDESDGYFNQGNDHSCLLAYLEGSDLEKMLLAMDSGIENELIFLIDHLKELAAIAAAELGAVEEYCAAEPPCECDKYPCGVQVSVAKNVEQVSYLLKRGDFVMLYLPNGAAVFL